MLPATLDGGTRSRRPEPTAQEAAAKEPSRLAREQSLTLTGPDGLLKQLHQDAHSVIGMNERLPGCRRTGVGQSSEQARLPSVWL